MAKPALSMAEPEGGEETHVGRTGLFYGRTRRWRRDTPSIGPGNPLAFGKSKAKFQMEPNTGVTFADVAGVCSFRFPNHVPTTFFSFFFKP
jgi:hypothetical protein